MIGARQSFAYVVRVEGASVTLNLHDLHRGQVAASADGLSAVCDAGALIAIGSGDRLFVARVRTLYFAEPREAHSRGVGGTSPDKEPLRHVEAAIVGFLRGSNGRREFVSGSLFSPPLGAEAYVLSREEAEAVLAPRPGSSGRQIEWGRDVRTRSPVRSDVLDTLPRHVAVLGSTGQGKSCLTATVLQQLAKAPKARIVVFDINGEYEAALSEVTGGLVENGGTMKVTRLGGPGGFKIPYYALGRAGLFRLLNPSDKTQAPALTFALEKLGFLQSASPFAAGLVGENADCFFDDCRPGNATDAWNALQELRHGQPAPGLFWPPMSALGALCADSHCVRADPRGNGYKRDGFEYSAVSPLITRIRRRIEDPKFCDVVDVRGAQPGDPPGPLDWVRASAALADAFFGPASDVEWRVHIIDLRALMHDLMPFVLGALLETLAAHLFARGQANKYPTLLVLEEAHHYLRGAESGEDGVRSSLAYERLAKEGRKFGLSMWVSTQRPSEVSPTVLGQCGTWAVFRLSSEVDRKAVLYAAEWADRSELERIAGLPRQQALLFGTAVPTPVRIDVRTANPKPASEDSDFHLWWNEPDSERETQQASA